MWQFTSHFHIHISFDYNNPIIIILTLQMGKCNLAFCPGLYLQSQDKIPGFLIPNPLNFLPHQYFSNLIFIPPLCIFTKSTFHLYNHFPIIFFFNCLTKILYIKVAYILRYFSCKCLSIKDNRKIKDNKPKWYY